MSFAHHYIRDDGSIVEVCTTERADGDFHLHSPSAGLDERRSAVMSGSWAVVEQVHGSQVVDADPSVAPDADALITGDPFQPIAVQGADCAPIAFITDQGPIAVAHAGWRGLVDGVIGKTVARLADDGAQTRCAVVGPTIGPECYEFGEVDLDHVASRLGDEVRGATSSGSAALDLRAAITMSFDAVGVADVRFVAGCTACEESGFSHRARHESERHALVARIVPAGPTGLDGAGK